MMGIPKEEIIFLITILLLAINLKLSASDDTVKRVSGTESDVEWSNFDTDLWTLTIPTDSTINSTGFTISSDRRECTKALRINNAPSVEYLPERIYRKFPNLVALEAINCTIKAIVRDNFKMLSKLTVLHMDGNRLTNLRANAFADLKKLKFLSLTHNAPTKIDSKVFDSMSGLVSLHLGHNQLKYLATTIFESLGELRNISLNDNHFTFFGSEQFVNNVNLEYIWMENNEVQHISYTMFNYMPKLKFVDWSFNGMFSNFVMEKN